MAELQSSLLLSHANALCKAIPQHVQIHLASLKNHPLGPRRGTKVEQRVALQQEGPRFKYVWSLHVFPIYEWADCEDCSSLITPSVGLLWDCLIMFNTKLGVEQL